MSIPIDKLYHYIEGVAKDVYNDSIVIYRFYPHGSKKLEDLTPINFDEHSQRMSSLPICCYDQEPLNYQLYDVPNRYAGSAAPLYKKYNLPAPNRNLITYQTIYDKSILIHSEKRSKNVLQYKQGNFIPVYYWSHGLIALDWYRFAQYEKINKHVNTTFLIYNRAWSGTREYRLPFVDLLISYSLVANCKISLNSIEPELGIHYSNYSFNNSSWTLKNKLEDYVSNLNLSPSSASADYDIQDYNTTDFEVVLETLFDDDRLHLTEKILRPIALGQPFLLAATHGSLEYLRSYGFKTFASVVDESYDTIEDPVLRLEAIVKSMKKIAEWSEEERLEKMAIANQLAAYNRKHFFSSKFINQINDELRDNLKIGITELENTNTSEYFLHRRKTVLRYPEIKEFFFKQIPRQNIVKMLSKARSYYKRTLPKD